MTRTRKYRAMLLGLGAAFVLALVMIWKEYSGMDILAVIGGIGGIPSFVHGAGNVGEHWAINRPEPTINRPEPKG